MDNSAYVYIHVPFCKQKCNYCSFCSYEAQNLSTDTSIEAYLNALTYEITEEMRFLNANKIKTIYIGGGTPNLLSINQINCIRSCFLGIDFETEYEFTIECNPETLSLKYLKELRNMGINRLSFGAQCFNDEILSRIGRMHNKETIYRAVEFSKKAGFTNISLDLMYGLPLQNIDIWSDTLDNVLSLDIEHVSAYGLKIEKDTPIYKDYYQNRKDFPDEDMQADMFLVAHDKLTSFNYGHYEISNYAREGRESIHNINYWLNGSYISFGCSACGYYNSIRYYNTNSISDYISGYKHNRKNQFVLDYENADNAIMLGLRLSRGISLAKFKEVYQIDFIKKYEKVINKYRDFIELSEDSVKLTIEGMLLSNPIISEFIGL